MLPNKQSCRKRIVYYATSCQFCLDLLMGNHHTRYRTEARTCYHEFGDQKQDSPISDDLIYCVVAMNKREYSKLRLQILPCHYFHYQRFHLSEAISGSLDVFSCTSSFDSFSNSFNRSPRISLPFESRIQRVFFRYDKKRFASIERDANIFECVQLHFVFDLCIVRHSMPSGFYITLLFVRFD